MTIEAGTEGFHELELDFAKVGTGFAKEVEKVTGKGAFNIKKQWKGLWSGHPHIPMLPRAITYDLHGKATEADAEIGPDKEKRQGALGNVIEFGTENNAPIPGGLPSLAAEEPRYVQALADLAEEAISGRL